MPHSFLSLTQDRFETRCTLGAPLLNIGGETYDVDVVKEKGATITSGVYKAYKKGTKELLCEFCSWHMHGGPDMYQIEGASMKGMGDASLIVLPSLASWEKQFVDPDEDEEAESE